MGVNIPEGGKNRAMLEGEWDCVLIIRLGGVKPLVMRR